jgi:glycosyltransferase involved in cell wall biosynthesis
MTRVRKTEIVLLTGNSLCHNPRARKCATSLARSGYAVTVYGAWHESELKARDLRLLETIPFKFVPLVDSTLPGLGARTARLARRAGKSTADRLYAMTGLQSRAQLGFGGAQLLREALRTPADLYIAHSEPALHVGRALLRRGRRVGVDMEDWFSEDLLPEARRYRPVAMLRTLEQDLLSRGAFASCPSHAMSAALSDEYACVPPTVIYNAFEWSERTAFVGGDAHDRRSSDLPSLHWYSTTLGPGRGLEDLIAALAFVDAAAEVHLRGRPAAGFVAWLQARAPEKWRDKIFFHPLVANDQLLPKIAEHDIGFAGEMKYSRSRDLTVTNKMLHYLLGGLAVVASDTTGQREVARQAVDAVQLYPAGNAQALARVLNDLFGSRERRERAKAAALTAAQKTFHWERQEKALHDAVARALERPVVQCDERRRHVRAASTVGTA